MVMSDSQNKQRPPDIQTYPVEVVPWGESTASLLSSLQNSHVPSSRLFPWRPPEHSDPAFSPSTSFLISLAQGQAPERAQGFYAFFVFFVYPWHKPASSVDCWEGTWRLQISKLQLSKGMCLLSTLNYNLTYGKNKNTAMCIFSPAMIIIVLQTCFKLQLPKWKKHFKK